MYSDRTSQLRKNETKKFRRVENRFDGYRVSAWAFRRRNVDEAKVKFLEFSLFIEKMATNITRHVYDGSLG